MNIPQPKIAAPQLSAREIEGLQDYWRIYELHRGEIDIQLLRAMATVPQFRAVLQGVDDTLLASPEQQANMERQRLAIYQNDWQPFLLSLWQQGQMYAHTGIDFSTWFGIVGDFRKLMRPHLLDAYGDTPERLLAAMDSADILVELMMSTIGDSYLAAKEQLINIQNQSLKESEALYRNVFESAAVSIWDEDFREVKTALDGLRAQGITDFHDYLSRHPEFVLRTMELIKIRDLNKQSLHMFGAVDKTELLDSFPRIALPETVNTFTEEMAALAEGQPYYEGEALVSTLQGERKNVLLSISFSEDQLDHTIVSMMDITERKRIEKSLRDSEERFSKAFRASPDAIAISRMSDGLIMEVNHSWRTMFGFQDDEVLGRTSAELDLFIRAEDRTQTASLLQQQGSLRNYELELRHKSGEIRCTSLSSEKIEINGVVCALTILRDITEQKQAEKKIHQLNEELEERVIERTQRLEQANQELEQQIRERERAENRFRGLLESAPDPIIVVDNQGRIVLVNSQFQNTFNYSNEEVIELSLEQLMPDRFRTMHSMFRLNFMNRPTRRPMGIGLELYGKRKDGSEFPVEISLSPLETLEGTLVIASIRDITEGKQAQERIKKLNAELEQRAIQLESTNKELEAFSYSVSHDLRAPLRTIDGFSLAVIEDYGDQLPEEGHNYLMRIRAAAQRMAQLIDDLLNLSRVSRTSIKPEPTNLSTLVTQIIHELEQTEPDRNAEFSIAPGVIATCDPQLMKIVLDNLIRNAWKFTSRQESARIEFGVTNDPTEEHIYFVRDNGAGFDMAYTNKLFGAFQRLHTDSEFPGIGIGLAIVKRIVNRHGGRIWAKSEVGRGAAFFFTL